MTQIATRPTLGAPFRGQELHPEDAGYDDARALYNAMIDRRPAAIARCADVADVVHAVRHARRSESLLAVRGGGHNGAGLGSCDDGLCLDLSRMRGIRIDPKARTAWVQGGATWGDVDHAAHAYGLATPSGIISTTGVGGLTLGGGIGHLARRHGLTVDNLLSADVVLADGRTVTASAEEHPELFWALRGGGGNFGVVTGFEFRLHPVAEVIGGPMLWPLEMAADVMRFYERFMADAPRDLNGFFAFMTVPPGPPFPEHLHRRPMCGVVWCCTGTPERAAELLEPVRAFGPPALDGVQAMPFPALQSAFDALYPPGLHWYWRGHYVETLSDAAIEQHVEQALRMPTMHSTTHLYPIDGAVHDVDREETAFAYRDARWAQVICGVDPDPANAAAIRDWCVGYWDALRPHSAAGGYVNFLMEEGQERVRATYRDNYQRLRDVKAEYDPGNLFRVNQNIEPLQT